MQGANEKSCCSKLTIKNGFNSFLSAEATDFSQKIGGNTEKINIEACPSELCQSYYKKYVLEIRVLIPVQ